MGQVGSHRQPQLIREQYQVIGRDGRQFTEGHHAQTLRPDPYAAKLPRNGQGGGGRLRSRADRHQSINGPSPEGEEGRLASRRAPGRGLGQDGRVLIVRATNRPGSPRPAPAS